MKFNDRLRITSRERNSFLCIGLDSDVDHIPPSIKNSDNPLLHFNREIIRFTEDLVCAYKLNLGFYLSGGRTGFEVLKRTVEFIPENLIVIMDAKCGDIGNSSRRYALAFFKELGVDAVTVNPFMGEDSLHPFIEDERKRFAYNMERI
ncbi:MAG: orotidine-5'-phosphate decarboxylase, partial [Fidelibacterota bacterium]